MEKIKKILQNLAESESEMADEAYQVLVLLENADEAEVAEYIATHDADMRRLLGVKNLAEKGADTELAEQYFDLYTKGGNLLNPDPYRRTDYYGNDVKDVDHYMELLGVSKEGGEYTNDQRAAFTNPESPEYFGKRDRDYLQGRAMKELGNAATADDLMNIMTRMADSYRYNREQRGYNADNSTDVGAWLTDLGQEIFLPRMREARLAGREWGWEDLFGDAVELGLNFVPGVGVFNKAGKLVARLPKGMQIPARLLGEAVESAAVPLGSQAYDVIAYDENDPRGQWDWKRVGAQYAGAIGAKGTIKMGARTAKDAANFAGGKSNETGVKQLLDVAEDLGHDSQNALNARNLVLQERAKVSLDPAYSRPNKEYVSGQSLRTGEFRTPEPVKDLTDFEIRRSEAERLAGTQKFRDALDAAQAELDAANREYYVASLSGDMDAMRAAALRRSEASRKFSDANRAFMQSDLSGREIVQLPDGRLAYKDGGIVGGTADMEGVKMPYYYPRQGATPSPLPEKVTVLKQYGEEIPDVADTYRFDFPEAKAVAGAPAEQTVAYAPRDYTVIKTLPNDPAVGRDLEAVMQGRAKFQKPVNTATNVLFNAGAREGIVGQGLDLDEKRRNALWNQMLGQLRPYVGGAKGISPKEKRARVDAIMNVLSYGGLDNLPAEVYKKDPERYEEIATALGMRGWMHWSSPKAQVNDAPSASSTYTQSSSSGAY